MNKPLPFYIAVILFVFLASCKGKDQASQQDGNSSKPENELPNLFSLVEKVDTIFTQNTPSRITRKIRKDSDGNLIIAAFDDVILYDGESFSNLPRVEGFESIDAFDALEDSKGNIWIASTHLGVIRYDGKVFKHFTTDDGLAHNRTIDIYEDKAGNIWIATMGGASRYNGKSFQNFTIKEGMAHNDVNTIMEDRTGKIWFGTRGATCIYNPSSSSFNKITNNEGEPLRNVRSIIEDKKGTIWLSSQEGVWRYSSSPITPLMRVSNEGGNYIYEDKNGNIWFTYGSVLSFFSKESLNLSKPKATKVFVGEGMFFGISEDKEGNIWVGTLQGVFNYNGKSIKFYSDALNF